MGRTGAGGPVREACPATGREHGTEAPEMDERLMGLRGSEVDREE